MPPKRIPKQEHIDASSESGSSISTYLENPNEHSTHYHLQSQLNKSANALKAFLKSDWIVPRGDTRSNIINRIEGIPYNIPDVYIPGFFNILQKSIDDKCNLYFNEKQDKESSGIMLDFDIYQKIDTSQFTDNSVYNRLVNALTTIICKLFNITSNGTEIIHAAITKRSYISVDKEKGCFKDGLHVLFPGVKISRSAKRFLIHEIITSGTLDSALDTIIPADITINGKQYTRSDFLDKNSAHVPVFFFGNISKPESSAYRLEEFYKIEVKGGVNSLITIREEKFDPDANICYELSLNFQSSRGKIQKRNYKIFDMYSEALLKFAESANKSQAEHISRYGLMNIQRLSDGLFNDLDKLLSCIDVKYLDNYNSWMQILRAIANASVTYKMLAITHSQRSKKYDEPGFEKAWNGIVKLTEDGKNTTGYYVLVEFAKQSDPEKYRTVQQESVYGKIWNSIFLPQNNGKLSDSDIANVIFSLCRYKYATDRQRNDAKCTWYEFVVTEDSHIDGELYKWRCNGHIAPNTLYRYISDVLPALFSKVLDSLSRLVKNCAGEYAKYYEKIRVNFCDIVRCLGNSMNKARIITELASLFHVEGFMRRMDKLPNVIGFSNGILVLPTENDMQPRLIKGYHTYAVSNFTETPYIQFNPFNPRTKELIIMLRAIFPDNEPDSHEFIMSMMALALDRKFKDVIFLILSGGGSNAKTTIMELTRNCLGEKLIGKLDASVWTTGRGNAESASPALASIAGKSLVVSSETDNGVSLSLSKMKELTGSENITTRRLYQDVETFRPTCNFCITTNNEPTIVSNDHGTWRRLKFYKFKHKFINTDDEFFDEKNPRHRLADRKYLDEWPNDKEILGIYAGYLIWLYFCLLRKYGGKLKRVPHKHIEVETLAYRNSQDTLNEFITKYAVLTVDQNTIMSIDDAVAFYADYLKSLGANFSTRSLGNVFHNSELVKRIEVNSRMQFLKGIRFLKKGEIKREDETYFKKDIMVAVIGEDNLGIKPESPEEYYKRVCSEFKEFEHLFKNCATFDIDDNKYDLDTKPKFDNKAKQPMFVNGQRVPDGAEIKKLEDPLIDYKNANSIDDYLFVMSIIDDSKFEVPIEVNPSIVSKIVKINSAIKRNQHNNQKPPEDTNQSIDDYDKCDD